MHLKARLAMDAYMAPSRSSQLQQMYRLQESASKIVFTNNTTQMHFPVMNVKSIKQGLCYLPDLLLCKSFLLFRNQAKSVLVKRLSLWLCGSKPYTAMAYVA